MERGGASRDLIGYQSLIREAQRNVARAALRKVARNGALPGDHHFYITFRTRLAGVQMADVLKDQFPDEMTIVIQHQYWDLEVGDDRFEIVLRFGGVPQHIAVPFAAVTRFYDPSVNFGLQLDAEDTAASQETQGARAAERTRSAGGETSRPAADATVVSLDAFRRK